MRLGLVVGHLVRRTSVNISYITPLFHFYISLDQTSGLVPPVFQPIVRSIEFKTDNDEVNDIKIEFILSSKKIQAALKDSFSPLFRISLERASAHAISEMGIRR